MRKGRSASRSAAWVATGRLDHGGVPVTDDPPLKEREVAELLGESPRTVRRWRRKGLLPFIKFGGTVRVRRSDLERALRPASDDGRPDPVGSGDGSRD